MSTSQNALINLKYDYSLYREVNNSCLSRPLKILLIFNKPLQKQQRLILYIKIKVDLNKGAEL